MGVSQHSGYHFRGPNNKDCTILGSILGSPYFGKLSYWDNGKMEIILGSGFRVLGFRVLRF